MKIRSTSNLNRHTARKSALLAMVLCGALAGSALAQATATPGVLPPGSTPYGKSYGQWSAEWWKWALALPVDGHPFLNSPDFHCNAGQTGHVWFLGAPFDPTERTCTIPAGKSVFFALLNAECSDLEGLGTTEADQRTCAKFFADHISDLFCSIDGVPVKNLAAYGVQSPQFTFTAPTPWIFGDTGGTGTSVSDGYFLMLAPLSRGAHTLRYGGSFHFSTAEGDPFNFDGSIDITYHLIVTQFHRGG